MTTVKHHLPDAILLQHLGVLGKTGSGKTSSAKLAIEQVVATGARVCILDPIKSDWWGLTSSASGKAAGLPFHILGGPHGHVPLHSAAGKAIAEVVGSGALPLSIVDMADFEPGGQSRFFVDFAPTLLRKMRGVVYLVIEEAHLFAPKERSGIGAENLSIHWAKTMATAGRSKGIRLVLVTQRTQALHNALLGSCDTLIAHRLTAPADQEPVVKWLKANTSKAVLEQVSGSLSSLQTGEGWICSGEAKVFERVQFPRIATYDNTATPTGDGDQRQITTATVDEDKLRAIIGNAVDKVRAEDPRELRKRIADLERQVAKGAGQANPKTEPIRQPVVTIVEKLIITDKQLERAATLIAKADAVMHRTAEQILKPLSAVRDQLAELTKAFVAVRQPQLPMVPVRMAPAAAAFGRQFEAAVRPVSNPSKAPRPVKQSAPAGDGTVTGPELKILTALAELEALGLYPADKRQLGFLAGYTNVRSGGFSEPFARLMAGGLTISPRAGLVEITAAGRAAVGEVTPPASSDELQARILEKLTGPEQKLLRALLAHYPDSLAKEDLGVECGYANVRSGGFSEPFARLNTLGLVETPARGVVKASASLFLEER